MLYNNYLELIGNTPVVKLNTFRNIPSELFIKLEGNNPVGSMKDRVAKHIVESAERNYLLKKGRDYNRVFFWKSRNWVSDGFKSKGIQHDLCR